MSGVIWRERMRAKSFYVISFRKLILFSLCSLAFSLILITDIVWVYFNQPKREYYATSGMAPPVQLLPLSAPNNSSIALLPPDPVLPIEEKSIPQ